MIALPLSRARRWREDTGSMPIALLLTLVGLSLSALLAPMVLVQVGAARVDSARVRALHAAQAGLDIAIGHIRAAHDTNGDGVLSKLPCGPFGGNVTAGGTSRYDVTIDYLTADPQGKSSSWVSANRVNCIAGGGTPSTPAFALITAKGSDLPTGPAAPDTVRTLKATYTFSTTNQNIPGGLIHVYKTPSSNDLCLDAGSSSPAAGALLRVRTCSSGSPQQTFTYDKNLNLVLASSRTASTPLGMCIDADTPHAAGNPVRLQPCAATTQPRQQWSYNGAANFEGTADGIDVDYTCLNVQSPDTSGSQVILGTESAGTCYMPYDIKETFSAEASVGAGAAGAATNQLVDFQEFGRCLDVTGGKLNTKYLIVWPCKQSPDPANVAWNQKWALPAIASGASSATGTIVTTPSAGDYCLNSPLSTTTGSYVTIDQCPSGAAPPAMSWTVHTDTGSYPTSYTIVDSAGYCLSPTDPSAQPPDFYSDGTNISKVVVAPCDGSTLQKWNAPPTVLKSALKDISEK